MAEFFKQLPTHDGTGTFSNGDDMEIHSFTPTSFSSSLPSNLSVELLDFFTDDSDKQPQTRLVSDVVCRRRKSSTASLCDNCKGYQSQLQNSLFAQSAGLSKRTSVDCGHTTPRRNSSYLIRALELLNVI